MQFVFFFNDTATTEIYTLSLHDALPICGVVLGRLARVREPIREHAAVDESGERLEDPPRDQGPPRRERETRQRDHRVAPPVPEPVIAGDHAHAVGIIAERPSDHELIGREDQLADPLGRPPRLRPGALPGPGDPLLVALAAAA